MRLDERLGLAYDLYAECELAADIGTDHGYLPLALLRSGKCRRMILTDISPDALNNARNHFISAGMTDRAELRQGDGLDPVTEACGMISILGMGGKTIRGMLERGAGRLQGAKLLLSAHTDLPQVRSAVETVGYHLTKEIPCRAAGRFYLMMLSEPGMERLTDEEKRRGKRLTDTGSPLLAAYMRHRLKVVEAQIRGLKSTDGANPALLSQAEADEAYYREEIGKLQI